MGIEEPQDLRRRADGGDPEAAIALGLNLLGADGPARHVPAGARYIAAAAAKDHPVALERLAVLVAAGIANAPSWDRAMDLLQRAAERGSAAAQDQLRFLSQVSGDDFAALRARIDIAAWLRPPQATVVCEAPRIVVARGLMNEAECKRVIAKMRGDLTRAGIYDEATGKETMVDERSNSKAEVSLLSADVPFILLHARMSAILGLPSQFFEPTNILHYRPGQEFKLHYDFLDSAKPGLAANMQALGQRIVTLLVYLNDDYQGGETQFPEINYAFKGRTGDALMFANVTPDGAADPRTLHAGLPPISGEKWLLSQWVRNRPAAPGEQAGA